MGILSWIVERNHCLCHDCFDTLWPKSARHTVPKQDICCRCGNATYDGAYTLQKRSAYACLGWHD